MERGGRWACLRHYRRANWNDSLSSGTMKLTCSFTKPAKEWSFSEVLSDRAVGTASDLRSRTETERLREASKRKFSNLWV